MHQALAYTFTAATWEGKAGLGVRIPEHLQYTAVAAGFSDHHALRGRVRAR